MRKLLLGIICLGLLFSTTSYADLNSQFEAIQSNPAELRAFLQAFPKGGDLHMHLSGSVTAEAMINMASDHNLFLDKDNWTLVNHTCKNCIAAKGIAHDYALYFDTINHWSLRGASNHTWSLNHFKFFDIFTKFHVLSDYWAMMFENLNQTAKEQNIQYLEIMFVPDVGPIFALAKANDYSIQNSKPYLNYLDQNGLHSVVDHINQQINHAFSAYSAKAGGNKTLIRLQYSVLRDVPLKDVFSQFAVAFEVAKSNPYVVGVNIIQAEDAPDTLMHYTQQMEIIHFFRKHYPSVHVSVHAGELWQGLIPLRFMGNHVKQAVEIAKPDRIGHATDIDFEATPYRTLKTMRLHHIPIEVNLTSNHLLMGVPYSQHPIRLFIALDNPFVLSTDDPGVLRTNLTNEFEIATMQYHLSYSQLVKLARNSLMFAFLPGKSLWQSDQYKRYVSACQGQVPGKPVNRQCDTFLNQNEKAKEQWQLENRLKAFEQHWFKQ